jgi:hypothetical protein
MITNAEQEVLSLELLWAYALKNVRFTGLLWALIKSTPGLLGLWAQQINLNAPLDISLSLQRAMDPSDLMDLGAKVPWAANLMQKAAQNWPLIRQFILEGDVPSIDTQRDARNAELATMLHGRIVLSPFAVAVTVMALRGKQDPTCKIFRFLNSALMACANHTAGCAKDATESWRISVQKGVLKSKNRSPILMSDKHLGRQFPKNCPLMSTLVQRLPRHLRTLSRMPLHYVSSVLFVAP